MELNSFDCVLVLHWYSMNTNSPSELKSLLLLTVLGIISFENRDGARPCCRRANVERWFNHH